MSMIVYCHCADYQLVPDEIKSRALKALVDNRTECKFTSDLCKMAVQKKEVLQDWMKEASDVKILACYSRTIKCLFEYAGITLPKDTEFVNLRVDDIEKVVSELSKNICDSKKIEKPTFKKAEDWIPWFPVIDYDRCENCKQCLNFCLFGVYELSKNEQVQVTNPAGCKTNCPACARLCPCKAIIFPKYSDSPINGDEVGESKKADLNPDEIYEILKRRSKTKKRFEKDRADRQGIDLTKLKDQLGIPSEVLESLNPAEVAKLRKKSEKNNRE